MKMMKKLLVFMVNIKFIKNFFLISNYSLVYGSCFLRKKNEINEYPREINLCGPQSEFNSNDSVCTMTLIKNEKKEVKRLKEKGLFNPATFNYIY
jgi:hypothetical protein